MFKFVKNMPDALILGVAGLCVAAAFVAGNFAYTHRPSASPPQPQPVTVVQALGNGTVEMVQTWQVVARTFSLGKKSDKLAAVDPNAEACGCGDRDTEEPVDLKGVFAKR